MSVPPPPLPPRRAASEISVTVTSLDEAQNAENAEITSTQLSLQSPSQSRSQSPAVDASVLHQFALQQGYHLARDAPPPYHIVTGTHAKNSSIASIDTNFLGIGEMSASVKLDGRIDVFIPPKSPMFSARGETQHAIQKASLTEDRPIDDDPQAWTTGEYAWIPLNIVILIVGSRGDVQPFIALGKELLKYGHRIRLATHETFRSFVLDAGLGFYPLGADPAELMAYAVKNPGLIPGIESIRAGDIGKRRQSIAEILTTCWDACIKPDDYEPFSPFVAQAIISNPVTFAHIHCAERLGVPLHIFFTMPWSPTKAFPAPLANIKTGSAPVTEAARDAGRGIIRQGSSSVDASLDAQRLTASNADIPSRSSSMDRSRLTDEERGRTSMDQSRLRAASPAPSDLSRVSLHALHSTETESLTNLASYYIMDTLAWTGLGDLINDFRKRVLNLPTLTAGSANNVVSRLKVPHTYCWSPGLIPKPRDWGDEIDICGFFFLDLATGYTPPQDLADFLAAGDAPIYIGFGSVVVDNPDLLTKTIFEAVEKSGVRAIVSKGWGGLGGDELKVPDNVYMIGNCPHDWLFKQVAGVVHHGGAGTTATGLRLGRPTFVVPFFGDQPFWGSMVSRRGCGPPPIKHKRLTSDNLAAALTFLLRPECKLAAERVAEEMSHENGLQAGVKSFHRHLPLRLMSCDLSPPPPSPHARLAKYAVSVSKKLSRVITISPVAADALMQYNVISKRDLHPFQWVEWDTCGEPRSELIGGLLLATKSFGVDVVKGASALIGDTASGIHSGTQGQVEDVAKGFATGVGKAIWFPVKGFGKAVGHLGDGLRNTPNIIDGSATQERAEVDNVGQGLLEGQKAFFVGLGEGMTQREPRRSIEQANCLGVYDFFAKPIKGGITGGWTGAARGFAGGTVSVAAKPMAGMFDMVYQTSKGINRSAKDLIDKEGAAKRKEAKTISATLASQGPALDAAVTEEQKGEFVALWKQMKEQVKQDKVAMLDQAKQQREQEKQLKEAEKQRKADQEALKKSSTSK